MTDSDSLPPCDFREPTDRDNISFCRHSQVRAPHHLVSPAICRLCSVREKPCPAPRDPPAPGSPLIPAGSSRIPAPIRNGGHPPSPVRPPSLLQQGWNVAQALAAFTADGFQTVTKEQYEARLAICETCDRRRGTRCLQCGCGLALKAKGRAFQCPLKKWPI